MHQQGLHFGTCTCSTLCTCCARNLQLCDGASDAERAALRLKPAKQFRYLSQSNCFDLRGVSNAEEYRRTRRSMSVVGIPEPEQVRALPCCCCWFAGLLVFALQLCR